VTDNVLRRLYLDDAWRRCFVDWEGVSGSAVAQFRVATAGMIGSGRWREFVARLIRESADFAGRWSRHELATAFPREKVVRHPHGGELTFLYGSVAPDAEPSDVRMIVYTPADAVTVAKLASLVDAPAAPAGATRAEMPNGAGQRPRAVRGRSR
jgi:transcription regulator MmyB-like protein